MLKRANWSAIADIARREFNDRLKAAKVRTGRWHTGTNLVERLLGKELCVLAWAAETANDGSLWSACELVSDKASTDSVACGCTEGRCAVSPPSRVND